MAHYVYVAMFLCAQTASGFIMPMTKPNGDADVSSMVSHVALLEQSMATLQAQVQTSNSLMTAELKSTESDLRAVQTELATTKNEMSALKAEMKTTELELNSARTELKVTTDSLHAVEARLRSAESEILTLKNDKQLHPTVADLAMMKTELMELKSASKTGFNLSFIGSIDNDVKSNTKNIECMKSRISANSQNIKNTKLDLELNARDQRDLRRRCDSLGIQVNTTQRELQRFEVTQHDLWTNMSSKLTSLNTADDLASLKSLILKARINVAFQVSQSAERSSSASPLRFDRVDLNNGGGYAPFTGYFTAPAAGAYLFWMHVAMYHSNSDCSLEKDSQPVIWGTGHTSYALPWNTASATGVVHMDIGDKVFISCSSSMSTISTTTWGDSHFGGTLLRAD